MNKLTKNGVSTTTQKDSFKYETFEIRGRTRVQWDYRDAQGKLHTGIAKDLLEAKLKAAKHGYRE